MATQSPFSWLVNAAQVLHTQLPTDYLRSLKPPAWAVHEVQQRVVLLLNHILMQEPAARERLHRQQGRHLQVCWGDEVFQCGISPAGLFEWMAPDANGKAADLVLCVSEPSPFEIVKTVLNGDKPDIRIEGDVRLAAEVNWLIDHVRWEPEEDLARLIGDAPAHALMQTARRVVDALRGFMQQQTSKATP